MTVLKSNCNEWRPHKRIEQEEIRINALTQSKTFKRYAVISVHRWWGYSIHGHHRLPLLGENLQPQQNFFSPSKKNLKRDYEKEIDPSECTVVSLEKK